MSDNILLFLIAIVPTLAILIFFVFSDKFIEPKKYVLATFVLGIFIIAPLQVFSSVSIMIMGSSIEYSPFFHAFFKAAFLEEFFKFCVLFFFCVRFTEFNEPMDGIVYGIAASLGFAFYENLLYVHTYDTPTMTESLEIGWYRAFTAVPSHAFDGVIMGFFIGRHFFRRHENKINIYLALIIPVILHGSYDWVLMTESIHTNFCFLVIAIELFLVVYLYRDLKNAQMLKKTEGEKKIF